MCSPCLVRLDKALEWIPVLSTVSNLINIFQKTVIAPCQCTSSEYYKHLKKKSWGQCFILLIPIVGQIVKFIISRSHKKTEKKNEKAYNESIDDVQGKMNTNGMLLKEYPQYSCSFRVVAAALGNNPEALRYVREDFVKNGGDQARLVVKNAALKNLDLFSLPICMSLQTDDDVFALLEADPNRITSFANSESLSPEFFEKLFKRNQSLDRITQLVKASRYVFRFVPEQFKSNLDLMKLALAHFCPSVESMTFKTGKELVLHALKFDTPDLLGIYVSLSVALKQDKAIIKAIAAALPNNPYRSHFIQLLNLFPPEAFKERDVAFAAVGVDPSFFDRLDDNLKADHDLLVTVYANSNRLLNDSLLTNANLIKRYFEKAKELVRSYQPLFDRMPHIKSDRKLILALLENDHPIYDFIDPKLKGDIEIVMLAVKKHKLDVKSLSSEIQKQICTNKKRAQKVFESGQNIYSQLSADKPNLKVDHELALAALRLGQNFKDLHPDLRQKPPFLLKAVLVREEILSQIDHNILKNYPEIIEAALSKYPSAYSRVCEDQNFRIVSLVLAQKMDLNKPKT